MFVHVGERGSFTLGAAAARVPQSVASRRIAALEKHFGERLFDRSTRRAALTAFGRDMLPSAKRLVSLAEAMEYDAERAKLRPLTLAVPETCSVRRLAALDAAARELGMVLDLRPAGPAQRAELLRTHEVRTALVAVPPADAEWTVPLGVASPARPHRPEGVSLTPSQTTPSPETSRSSNTPPSPGPAFPPDGGTSPMAASRDGHPTFPTNGDRSSKDACENGRAMVLTDDDRSSADASGDDGVASGDGSAALPADGGESSLDVSASRTCDAVFMTAGNPPSVNASASGGASSRARSVTCVVGGGVTSVDVSAGGGGVSAVGGGGAAGGGEALHLESLRPGRARRSFRRIWIQPEDDVPHVRDRLEQIGHRVALVPAQIVVAASLVTAVSETVRTGDLLLCSELQAAELGLAWRPLAGAPVARGYSVSAVIGDDAERIHAGLGEHVARALGAPAEDRA